MRRDLRFCEREKEKYGAKRCFHFPNKELWYIPIMFSSFGEKRLLREMAELQQGLLDHTSMLQVQ